MYYILVFEDTIAVISISLMKNNVKINTMVPNIELITLLLPINVGFGTSS